MNNKKLGNKFENDFCNYLSVCGFWTHRMAQNATGQPADVIAARNGKAYLIDCKVCSNDVFALSRIEPNQKMAMFTWEHTGNGTGWFALKLKKADIYMMSLDYLMSDTKASINEDDIRERGTPIEEWVTKW